MVVVLRCGKMVVVARTDDPTDRCCCCCCKGRITTTLCGDDDNATERPTMRIIMCRKRVPFRFVADPNDDIFYKSTRTHTHRLTNTCDCVVYSV